MNLKQIVEGMDLDNPESLTVQQKAILELCMENEITNLCANSPHLKVPVEPVRDSTRCDGKDGGNGDVSHDEDVDNQRGFSNSILIGMLGENLKKLQGDMFGLCEDCEEPIGSGRLILMRFAAIRCRECQSLKERDRGKGFGRHTQVK